MAVQTSVKQMALTRDTGPGGFMERVTAMIAFVAGNVLTEPGNTAYHQPRAFYAQKVIERPIQLGQQAGPQIVMGVNVIQATTYDENTQKATCTIADIDLQSQIMTLWNSLAGIDSPSQS